MEHGIVIHGAWPRADWQQQAGRHAQGNSRLSFALSCAFVFPGAKEACSISPVTLTHAWTHVRKVAGIPDARLHDLRHTVGARAGAVLPAFMVQTILGHKQPSTTSRYAKPIDSATESAVHDLQRRIASDLGL